MTKLGLPAMIMMAQTRTPWSITVLNKAQQQQQQRQGQRLMLLSAAAWRLTSLLQLVMLLQSPLAWGPHSWAAAASCLPWLAVVMRRSRQCCR